MIAVKRVLGTVVRRRLSGGIGVRQRDDGLYEVEADVVYRLAAREVYRATGKTRDEAVANLKLLVASCEEGWTWNKQP